MSSYWIVIHPERTTGIKKDGIKCFYDSLKGNQDPYIWNKNFLYSYCQFGRKLKMINEFKADDVIFFLNTKKGTTDIKTISCDLVFDIGKKIEWDDPYPKSIEEIRNVVDSDKSYNHHYKYWTQHKRCMYEGKRYTFKAKSDTSFQPIDRNENLVNVFPIIMELSLVNEVGNMYIRNKETKKQCASRPFFKISEQQGKDLLNYILENSKTKHYGYELEKIAPS